MRARRERRQRRLDLDEQSLHGSLFAAPGEMDADRLAPVLRAHPELVGGDRADLADVQQRADPGGQGEQGGDRRPPVRSGHEVLGLKLLAGARHELETEVRQPAVPRPGHAQLLRASGGVAARDRVQAAGGGPRPEREPRAHPRGPGAPVA